MSAIKDHIIAGLPDGAEMRLWADADRIAQALHETHSRIVVQRRLVPGVTAWADLPRAVQAARIAACVELLERGVIAAPEPA